jgi:hypothetical protein
VNLREDAHQDDDEPEKYCHKAQYKTGYPRQLVARAIVAPPLVRQVGNGRLALRLTVTKGSQ